MASLGIAAMILVTTMTLGCKKSGGGNPPAAANPTVAATSPSNAAADVAVDATISFTFGAAMDASTIVQANLAISPPLAGALTYDTSSNTATFFSAAPMTALTTYTVTVSSACMDLAGNSMATDFTWSFTTAMALATDWVRVGDQIGANGVEAEDPTMLFVAGDPLVGYRLASFEVALNKWDGSTWGASAADPSAGNMEFTSYHAPSFCSDGNTIYLAFGLAGVSGGSTAEFYDRVFCFAWTPTGGWSPMNSGAEVSVATFAPPGEDAFEPAIACDVGGAPWVAWLEDDLLDGQGPVLDVGFTQVTPTTTVSRAAPLSRNETLAAYETFVRSAEVCVAGNDRFVAQWEHDASDQARTDLYVNRYDGSNWNDVGGILDSDFDANGLSKPALAMFGGELHVAYTTTPSGGTTRHVYVMKRSGGVWTNVGGGPVSALAANHYDSANPDLLVANGSLYVAWEESDLFAGPFVFVARLDTAGTAWVVDGDKLNVDAARQAGDPSLGTSGNFLYVAFEELTDGFTHIFVKRRQF